MVPGTLLTSRTMTANKDNPHKGRIVNWAKVYPDGPRLGYYVVGHFLDHTPAPGHRRTALCARRDRV